MNDYEKKIAQLEVLADIASELDDKIEWKKADRDSTIRDIEGYQNENPDASQEVDWRLQQMKSNVEKLEIKIETLKLAKTALNKMAGI